MSERSPAGPAGAVRIARAAAVATLAIAVALALSSGPLGAQESVVDAGSYELRVDDAVVGSEAFTIRRQGRIFQGVGRQRLTSDAPPFRPLEVWLQAAQDWRPTVFRLQPEGGEIRSVLALRDESRFRVQVESSAGNRWREYLAPPELVVLEPTVAHHYAFLLRQHGDSLDAGNTLEVAALVPSRNERLTLTLRPGAEAMLERNGRSIPTRRYDLTLADESIRIWADANRRVLRVEAPGRGWALTRAPEESGGMAR